MCQALRRCPGSKGIGKTQTLSTKEQLRLLENGTQAPKQRTITSQDRKSAKGQDRGMMCVPARRREKTPGCWRQSEERLEKTKAEQHWGGGGGRGQESRTETRQGERFQAGRAVCLSLLSCNTGIAGLSIPLCED